MKPDNYNEKDVHLMLAKVAENAPLVLFSIDKNGMFTVSEGKGLKKLGLKPGEVVGRSVREVYKDSPDILRDVDLALSGKEATSLLAAGEGLYQTTMSPVRDEAGKITGLVGVATDVTELENAKKQLVRKNEELKKVINAMVGREKKMVELKKRLERKSGTSESVDKSSV